MPSASIFLRRRIASDHCADAAHAPIAAPYTNSLGGGESDDRSICRSTFNAVCHSPRRPWTVTAVVNEYESHTPPRSRNFLSSESARPCCPAREQAAAALLCAVVVTAPFSTSSSRSATAAFQLPCRLCRSSRDSTAERSMRPKRRAVPPQSSSILPDENGCAGGALPRRSLRHRERTGA